MNENNKMYSWAKDLFPICRSITGEGLRYTLKYINTLLPDLKIHSIKSGQKAFNWTVPDEWSIKSAYIEDENGNRIIDFSDNNLHVLNYSEPVDKWLSLDDLKKHLYSDPDQPNAIPYVTSYYERRWGFCLEHKKLLSLKKGQYHAVIQSEIKPGVMNYGELIIKGKSNNEILLSTYVCHPSMANNELSGPAVTIALAQWLTAQKNNRYTYRILFLPETIGSIVYLSLNADYMKRHTIAGFILTCMGDDREYSYLPSRKGNTLADRVAKNVLNQTVKNYIEYSFLVDRGSDERQYCSPKIDLPVCSVMRSKYGTYPEYHTSLDNLDFISPEGLNKSYELLKKMIKIIEVNYVYESVYPCEPQLINYELNRSLTKKKLNPESKLIADILAYSDGNTDLIEKSDFFQEDALLIHDIESKLVELGLIRLKYY